MIARTNPLQLALTGFCGALLLVLFYEIAAPISPYQSSSSGAFRIPSINFADSVAAPPTTTFADIDARPVFNPSRQAIASLAGGTTAGSSASDLSLIGVIIDGTDRLALIRSTGAAFATGVKQGASIEGWTAVEVDADRVVLQSGVRKQELLLATNHGSAPATTNTGPGAGSAPAFAAPPPLASSQPAGVPLPQPVQTPDISSKPPLDPH